MSSLSLTQPWPPKLEKNETANAKKKKKKAITKYQLTIQNTTC